MNYFLIYLIGFIITYILLKYVRSKTDKNDWGDVGITIFVSLCSWLGLIFSILTFTVIKFQEIDKHSKPPKWM